MDKFVVANIFGTLGAVLWSLQLLPQIWKHWKRQDSEGLSSAFFLSWAVAGLPLGVYNIADDFNIALQIQPNILIFLSLFTWCQCKYYGEKWSWTKATIIAGAMAAVLAGAEVGLVFALRVARERENEWASMLMAIIAAVLLAGGVLWHCFEMIRKKSDAGVSLRFAFLDMSGDVASLVSVVFQPTLKIYGLVIYGSELAIWIILVVIVVYFRFVNRRNIDNSETETGNT